MHKEGFFERENCEKTVQYFPMGIDRCPRRGGGEGSLLSTAYLGNYVCHVCPFARFISHHPSAFTFRARTLLFFRLKLAYTAFVRTETQMLPQCSLSLSPSGSRVYDKIPYNTSGWRWRKLLRGGLWSSLTTLCKKAQPTDARWIRWESYTFEIYTIERTWNLFVMNGTL